MPTAIALRSFDHNGKVKKGQEVTFDRITMDALRRSMLVGPDIDGAPAAKVEAQQAPAPTVGTLGKAPKPKGHTQAPAPKAGKKSVASPAAPVSQAETLPPSLPGALPPPLPEK